MKINDVITIMDKDYLVSANVSYNNEIYYMIIDAELEEETADDSVVIVTHKIIDGELNVKPITDEKLIEKILPTMLKNLDDNIKAEEAIEEE